MFSLFKKEKGPEYISGRVATKEDVKFGFVHLVNDLGASISVSYKIEIPQDVVHINKETKEENKGKLVQAELVTQTGMKGQVICTVKLQNGETLHCLIEELQLSKNKFD